MIKQIEKLKNIDKDVLIAFVIVILTFAIPIYFFRANGIWIALFIGLVFCGAAGSEDGYD